MSFEMRLGNVGHTFLRNHKVCIIETLGCLCLFMSILYLPMIFNRQPFNKRILSFYDQIHVKLDYEISYESSSCK